MLFVCVLKSWEECALGLIVALELPRSTVDGAKIHRVRAVLWFCVCSESECTEEVHRRPFPARFEPNCVRCDAAADQDSPSGS